MPTIKRYVVKSVPFNHYIVDTKTGIGYAFNVTVWSGKIGVHQQDTFHGVHRESYDIDAAQAVCDWLNSRYTALTVK